jgi:outer membrane protein
MYARRRALGSAAGLALVAALSAVTLGVVTVGATAVSAETLTDAIELAYRTNPTLQQQRAAQRALDEEYVQARATLRPNVSATLGDNYTRLSENTVSLSPGAVSLRDRTAGINITQPLYTGGYETLAIKAAERDVLQGREQLRVTESQVMGLVIQAYMDTIRDAESLRINQQNVQVLQRQLQETSAEFDVGEVTRTDVAQAEARLAAAQASLSAAQSQLTISRANFAQVVGEQPGELAPPPVLSGLPSTFDIALDAAEKDNPSLRAAQYAEAAAHSRVGQARAAYRPTVSLTAGYQYQYEPIAVPSYEAGYNPNPNQRSLTAGVTVTIPIFTGGLTGSKVRQALEQDNQALYGIEGQRRTVLQSVSQAWAQLLSARAQTLSNEQQVKAAGVAAEGERQEAQVGLRTTIDVLNAEQELRNAELSLVQARHDEYVASASLLTAMGRLEAKNLNASGPVYDPRRNFDRVKSKGWTPLDAVVRTLDATGAPGGGGAAKPTSAPIDDSLAAQGVAKPAPQKP